MSAPNVERIHLQPFEIKTLGASFADTREISVAGESLSGSPAAVTITKLKGTGTLSAGAVSLSGNHLSALFTGTSLAVGDLFKVVWLATTSAGHTLQITGEISIVEAT